MADGTLSRFVDRLGGLGVEYTRVSRNGCQAAIEQRIEPPAVGVPLPFDGATLPSSVTTAPTPGDLRGATTGVSAGALGIADYGSILLEVDSRGAELVSLFNRLHVIVLRTEDVAPDLREGLAWIGRRAREDDTSTILATGPSATADMGALVMGAHGPERVSVILLDDDVGDDSAEGGGATDGRIGEPPAPEGADGEG